MRTYLFYVRDFETKVFNIEGNILKKLSLVLNGKPIATWYNTVKFSFEKSEIIFQPNEEPFRMLNKNVFLDAIHFLGFNYNKSYVMATFIEYLAAQNNLNLKENRLIFVLSHNLFLGVSEVEGTTSEEKNFTKVIPDIVIESFSSLRSGEVYILLDSLLNISLIEMVHNLSKNDPKTSHQFNIAYLDDDQFFSSIHDDLSIGIHQKLGSNSASFQEKYRNIINPLIFSQYEDLFQFDSKTHQNILIQYLLEVSEPSIHYDFQDHQLIIPIKNHQPFIDELKLNLKDFLPDLMAYKKEIPLLFIYKTEFSFVYQFIISLVAKLKILPMALNQMEIFEEAKLYYAYYLIDTNHPKKNKAYFINHNSLKLKDGDMVTDENYIYNFSSFLRFDERIESLQQSKIYKWYKNSLKPFMETFKSQISENIKDISSTEE